MAEASTFTKSPAQSALAAHWHKGRSGEVRGEAGVRIVEIGNVAIASIAVRKGQTDALLTKVKTRTGIDLPMTPRQAISGHLSFTWCAPGQWFAMAEGEDGAVFADDLARDLSGLSSVTDQTDGRTVLRVSGARIRDMLAKGCMLDLHDKVFKVGDTAVTPIALLNTQITRLPDANGAAQFELSVTRSFSVSLLHFLEASSAEFGLQLI